MVAGSAAIALAALLWAIRVTEGARGGVEAWKKRARELEDTVAWADAVFGAHPGVVLIWEDTLADSDTDWGKPRIYGSPLALASLLRFSGSAHAAEPAIRILQGLTGFDARGATGVMTRLAAFCHERHEHRKHRECRDFRMCMGRHWLWFHNPIIISFFLFFYQL